MVQDHNNQLTAVTAANAIELVQGILFHADIGNAGDPEADCLTETNVRELTLVKLNNLVQLAPTK